MLTCALALGSPPPPCSPPCSSPPLPCSATSPPPCSSPPLLRHRAAASLLHSSAPPRRAVTVVPLFPPLPLPVLPYPYSPPVPATDCTSSCLDYRCPPDPTYSQRADMSEFRRWHSPMMMTC